MHIYIYIFTCQIIIPFKYTCFINSHKMSNLPLKRKRCFLPIPKAKGKANIELMGVEHFEEFYVKHGTKKMGGVFVSLELGWQWRFVKNFLEQHKTLKMSALKR